MPHVIIRFRLPNEQTELNAAMQGAESAAAIWEVDQYCRSILKHGEPSAETRRHLEEIRELMQERPRLLNDSAREAAYTRHARYTGQGY